ncbi:MAG: tetratricopeptide repeat protein [Acidobacteriota bacterium]|nr:tetratricopeptide repeat protein [Acidobacteriota bacterium]
MRRTVFIVLLFASAAGFAQLPGQKQPAQTAPAQVEPVSAQVADAEAAIVKSDWKTAETKLDAWLASHPTDARALFDAGYVADAQNRLEDASGLYRRAVTANPKSFEARLSLGLLLARQGKLPEARTELLAATALDPGEAGPAMKGRAWRALAEIDRDSDPAAASNELIEALKISPETESDTLLAAALAEKSGQADAAEAAYRRVLAKDPKSEPANAGLAHLLIVRKEYAEAETLLRAALAQAPDDPALTAQLATVLAAQDKAEALPLLQKLHAAHPDDQAITHMLADVLAQAGDAAGSDKLYAALLAANPNDPGLLVTHGQNLIRQLKYGEAYATFNKATQVDPTNGDAWSGLAFAALKVGQPSITLHALTMRSKYLQEVPATYFLWATAYDTLRDKLQAASYYHQFLNAAAGRFPDQEWQARQRLQVLEKKK